MATQTKKKNRYISPSQSTFVVCKFQFCLWKFLMIVSCTINQQQRYRHGCSAKIWTHDLNIEIIRACVYIFGSLIMLIYSLLTVQLLQDWNVSSICLDETNFTSSSRSYFLFAVIERNYKTCSQITTSLRDTLLLTFWQNVKIF